MDNIENNKKKQINDIVSVVKIASLLFTSIIFFQFLAKDYYNVGLYLELNYSVIMIALVTSILAAIYLIWIFTGGRRDGKFRSIEDIVFIMIFLVAIMLSGVHSSECKYIFLFIIITSTIQSGMKKGIIIATISSLIILTIDIIYAPSGVVNKYFESDLILVGIFFVTAWTLGFYVKIEGEHIIKLQSLANKDGLTGVYNHRYFQDSLKMQIEISNKTAKPVSMIFIDIDYFKHYNDIYGHQRGDEVLRGIGEILRKNVRKYDIVARYGGEEFAIILPNTKEDEALELADNIRIIIENTKFYGEENQPKGVLTVSMGVSIYPDKAKSDIDLIKSSDDALYRAKFFNKNRVEGYIFILDGLQKGISGSELELVTSIKTLISVINAKDRYTYSHSERVVFYSRLFAKKLKLSEEDTNTLVYGSYMHDIGKINIPKEILIKRMPLTREECELLEQHPQNGIEIIKSVKSLEKMRPLILYHHEKFDGTGYPKGLKGEEIPYLARVLTVLDCFDAMTSKRPYNDRKRYDEAIRELIKCSGTQFDPKIVESFVELIEEIKENLESFS